MVGDIWGSFQRSIILGLTVMVITVVFSVGAGMAYRKNSLARHRFLPYHCKLGHSIDPSFIGCWPDLFSVGVGSSLVHFWPGAQLTWTLPFGILIMFAVFNRFDKAYEEAGRDLGQVNSSFRLIVLPIIAL